jgi:2-amino-4-hydroxy-6-hydroxymethyldihydropteridine diphosphokinase
MSAQTGVYLGLGTNLGDRAANLRAACAALAPQVQTLRLSRIYQTPPWGYADQPAFLNQVAEVRTTLPPLELLALLKDIEVRLGRTPSFQYGPRLIDMDILLYGSLVLQLPQLVIPHPRLPERAFVLVPLAELSPELIHPVLKTSIGQLCAAVDSAGVEVFHAKN